MMYSADFKPLLENEGLQVFLFSCYGSVCIWFKVSENVSGSVCVSFRKVSENVSELLVLRWTISENVLSLQSESALLKICGLFFQTMDL